MWRRSCQDRDVEIFKSIFGSVGSALTVTGVVAWFGYLFYIGIHNALHKTDQERKKFENKVKSTAIVVALLFLVGSCIEATLSE